MDKLGIYNPFCGITNNQSEGFNTVLKQLQHWKEVPVDAIILSLYHLQSFYFNEIQRGFSGLGTYSLADRYSALTRPCDEILTNPVHSPEEIVKRMREKFVKEDTSCQTDVDTEDKEPCELVDELQPESDGATQTARARCSTLCVTSYCV